MVSIALQATAVVFVLLQTNVQAQFQIRRNTDDCINPPLTTDDWRIWPNTNYMMTGTGTTRDSGGNFVVTNRANFKVTYYKTYKIVENGAAGETYVLYHCGAPVPTSYPPGAKLFQIPLTSISADDTSAAEFAKQCGAVDRVAFVTDLISSGCMQLLAGCGYVAPDPNKATDLQSQVDAFFTFSKTSNPKSIAMSAVTADSPLSRAEWLKYVSVFYNREWESETLFRSIRTAYNDLKRSAQARANAMVKKTIVLWVYKGWNADYVVSKAPYKLAYVQDAGGVMPADSQLQALGFTQQGKGTWSIPEARTDVWKTILRRADVIITEDWSMANGGLLQLKEFTDAHGLPSSNTGIPAVDKGEVYSLAGVASQTVTDTDSKNLGMVGLDWFERGTSRCDEVLRDFVKVCTPSTSHPAVNSWSRKWLLKLSDPKQKQIKIGLVCDNDTAKLNDKCQRTVTYPAAYCPNTIRNCNTNVDASQLGCMSYPRLSDRCTALSAQKRLIRQLAAAGKTCPVAAPTKMCTG